MTLRTWLLTGKCPCGLTSALCKAQSNKPEPMKATCPRCKTEYEITAKERDGDAEPQTNPLLDYGIDEKFLDCTLSGYKPKDEYERRAKDAAQEYCENIDSEKHQGEGILFYGETGHGKTHLLTAILKAYFDRGKSIRYMTVENFFLGLRDTFAGEVSERKYIDRFVRVEILALDDLYSAKAPDSYQQRMLWQLLDERYRKLRRTITASNKPMSELLKIFEERTLRRFQAVKWAVSAET